MFVGSRLLLSSTTGNAIYQIIAATKPDFREIAKLDTTTLYAVGDDTTILQEPNPEYIALNGPNRQFYPNGCAVKDGNVYFTEIRNRDNSTHRYGALGIYNIATDEFRVDLNAIPYGVLGNDIAVYGDILLLTSWDGEDGDIDSASGTIWYWDMYSNVPTFSIGLSGLPGPTHIGSPSEDGLFCVPLVSADSLALIQVSNTSSNPTIDPTSEPTAYPITASPTNSPQFVLDDGPDITRTCPDILVESLVPFQCESVEADTSQFTVDEANVEHEYWVASCDADGNYPNLLTCQWYGNEMGVRVREFEENVLGLTDINSCIGPVDEPASYTRATCCNQVIDGWNFNFYEDADGENISCEDGEQMTECHGGEIGQILTMGNDGPIGSSLYCRSSVPDGASTIAACHSSTSHKIDCELQDGFRCANGRTMVYCNGDYVDYSDSNPNGQCDWLEGEPQSPEALCCNVYIEEECM